MFERALILERPAGGNRHSQGSRKVQGPQGKARCRPSRRAAQTGRRRGEENKTQLAREYSPQKYAHPEAGTIDEVFSRMIPSGPVAGSGVGTKSGTVKKNAASLAAASLADELIFLGICGADERS